MSDTTKILIIGNSGSGKTTLAGMIAEHFNCDFMGTSQPIYNELYVLIQIYEYRNIFNSLKSSMLYGDLFRKFLFAVGNRMRENDPAALVKICLAYGPIVEGVRTREEFNACKHLFDYTIWIDRPSTEPNETDELRIEDADEVFDNKGTLEDLRQLVEDWFD